MEFDCIAFISKLAFNNLAMFTWALVIASILGLLIALQAYQALKVKVVSIDI